jgi:hypothetical protein
VDCAAGTYAETGSSSCLTCSSAISVNAVRSTDCKECTVGTYYVIAKRPTNYSAEAVSNTVCVGKVTCSGTCGCVM